MIDQVTSERGPGIEIIFADDYNSHFNETETVSADVTSQTVTMTSQRPPTEQAPEVLIEMDSDNDREESYIKPTTDECKLSNILSTMNFHGGPSAKSTLMFLW